MNKVNTAQSGFTLVEIAIVLLIVTILLGYSVAMFPLQQELKQYRHVQAEMDSVIEHLVAFAQVNGRLPCPDTSTDIDTSGNTIDGEEDRLGINACEAYFGFLPGRTLGINGKYNAAGALIDPWDSGYGYAISDFNAGFAGNPDIDLVTPNGIRDEGISNVKPDLYIYLAEEDEFDNVPKEIFNSLGIVEFSMELEIKPDTKLAREDTQTVRRNLKEHGFHIQLAGDESIEAIMTRIAAAKNNQV